MPKFKVGEKVKTTYTDIVGTVVEIVERPPELKERYKYLVKYPGYFGGTSWEFESMLDKYIA